MSNTTEKTLIMALIILGAWLFVANVVFAFRHSWMTTTERLIWIKSAMLFQKVQFHEVRP